MRTFLLLPLVIAALTGCVSPQQFVASTAAPSPNLGYVGAQFVTANAGLATALILMREGSTEEIVFPFANARVIKGNMVDVGLLALPPGKYSIRAWMVYNAMFNEREFKQNIPPGPLTTVLDVQPNKVVFIGKFEGRNTWTPGYGSSTTRGALRNEPISLAEARSAFNAKYASFSALGFSCVLCY